MHPVFLRQGKPLSDGGQPLARLELISAEPFTSGVTLMKYRSPAHHRGHQTTI